MNSSFVCQNPSWGEVEEKERIVGRIGGQKKGYSARKLLRKGNQ